MVGRPFWSGQLKISLVSFGIELYPAVDSRAGVTFHQLDRETGERVHHRNVTSGDEPVENAEIVKGYEYSKGKYVAIDPDEIRRLRIPTRSTIEIRQFVTREDLPLALFEKPYFVVPDSRESTEAFAVVHKAMAQAKKLGLGEVAFGGREHLVAFAVPQHESERGLMAYTLRYSEELRKAGEYFSGIAAASVDKKQLAMAADLINAYSGPFNPDAFQDDYEEALRKLVEAKEKKMPLPLDEEKPRRGKVVGLMDALRRSLDEAHTPQAGRKRGPGTAKASSAKASAAKSRRAAKNGPVLVRPSRRKHKAA
jgi:DNA end-binding protein Ku